MGASPTSLKQAIQSLAPPDKMGVIEGTVVAASPLRIQACEDARLMLGASVLVVPQHLTDYEVEFTATGHISVQDVSGQGSLTGGKMTFRNALKEGDRVILLAFNGKERYMVLDRVGR